ncbi:hypothetical protein PMIN01_11595 [Paraphaeosphaeria minitans]|uniref:Uncharacterized protein n=1 Tax=Paraphaeosphaeria minitans TaxID=565426 RepID=A0A9P6G8T0_9PLEO|nr:hypothetical protein PMIN01_11595 [Paraphaeosphaeria minitans]
MARTAATWASLPVLPRRLGQLRPNRSGGQRGAAAVRKGGRR